MSEYTLAENLIRLQEAKEDIADAIVEMGGTASQYDGLEDMPDAIRTIQANPTLITKSITANGTYNASSDDADGYSEVTVAVPNTYSASDNGKVVQNGSLVSQTTRTVTANGTYDTTTNNSTIVNVQASGAVKNGTIEYYGTYGYGAYTDGDLVAIGIDNAMIAIFGYVYLKSSYGTSYIYQGTTVASISGIEIPSNKIVTDNHFGNVSDFDFVYDDSLNKILIKANKYLTAYSGGGIGYDLNGYVYFT